MTIPAGEKSVDFEIISNDKEGVEDKVYLEIGVKYPLPEADMGKVEEVLRVVVKPYMEAEDLTGRTTGIAGRVQGERVGFE